MGALKSNKIMNSIHSIKGSDRDEQILGNPLNSRHEVKDASVWVSSTDSRDKWAYKQLGL